MAKLPRLIARVLVGPPLSAKTVARFNEPLTSLPPLVHDEKEVPPSPYFVLNNISLI